MRGSESEVSEFLSTGIYRLSNFSGVFVDPVRLLNSSYSSHQVSSTAYYSRFFQSKQEQPRTTSRKKRKRAATSPPPLNQAELRHQEVRPVLVKAHESFLEATHLLSVLPTLRNTSENSNVSGVKQSLVQLGAVWQAPLFDITLKFHSNQAHPFDNGDVPTSFVDSKVLPIFNNLVANDTSYDVEAELLDSKYIIPRHSCFLMSDMVHINKLIPENSDCGFHLIVVDPPWENGSARQKSMYPTLPNKYFLSLPIKKLAHTEGAIVALWVTNREKLRSFVERELFAKWGVKHVATYYWLKVKADGSLISELDLFHHRPYECLLLGYCFGEAATSSQKTTFKTLRDDVIISIPGDYSRKPPLEEKLLPLLFHCIIIT
uniref:Methyltransferase-like protein 2 n=1 Tax=Kalanchoe fedtschenkoi TaxID=63787 RepID=A0A7N1A3V0_KALFE